MTENLLKYPTLELIVWNIMNKQLENQQKSDPC